MTNDELRTFVQRNQGNELEGGFTVVHVICCIKVGHGVRVTVWLPCLAVTLIIFTLRIVACYLSLLVTIVCSR